MRIDGGTLVGFGTISANVVSAGRIDLGAPIGTLQINGTFEQRPRGRWQWSTTVGLLFDRLVVTGSATLHGSLDAALSGGFSLTSGDSYEIMTDASRVVEFDLVTFPDARLRAIFDPTRLRLVVS